VLLLLLLLLHLLPSSDDSVELQWRSERITGDTHVATVHAGVAAAAAAVPLLTAAAATPSSSVHRFWTIVRPCWTIVQRPISGEHLTDSLTPGAS
jgi:hypothetical protein